MKIIIQDKYGKTVNVPVDAMDDTELGHMYAWLECIGNDFEEAKRFAPGASLDESLHTVWTARNEVFAHLKVVNGL